MEHVVKEKTTYKELGLGIDDKVATITYHDGSSCIEVEWMDENGGMIGEVTAHPMSIEDPKNCEECGRPIIKLDDKIKFGGCCRLCLIRVYGSS